MDRIYVIHNMNKLNGDIKKKKKKKKKIKSREIVWGQIHRVNRGVCIY